MSGFFYCKNVIPNTKSYKKAVYILDYKKYSGVCIACKLSAVELVSATEIKDLEEETNGVTYMQYEQFYLINYQQFSIIS